MEIEYSNEVKGKAYAYRFTDIEKQVIIKAFERQIKKLKGEIEKIRNHPKNEGQATYSAKIDVLRYELNSYIDNIEMLKP